MPKTYELIGAASEKQGAARVQIFRCAALLPNRMQCAKAGDFQITETDGEKVTTYQKCRYHANIEKAEDDAKAAQQPTPPAVVTPTKK
jgi:hypothetical protein